MIRERTAKAFEYLRDRFERAPVVTGQDPES